ncbi:MAG: FtsX-like permease family protein [Candidatus Heimdallarchaeota archaeon]
MAYNFYIDSALKNIRNSKRQSLIYSIGIVIALSSIISLQLWSSTAEDLAATNFLEDQDYEIKFTSYLTDQLTDIKNWVGNDSLVQSVTELYYNLAFFNAEEKPITYRFAPEDAQENMTDPVSVTALALFPKKSLKRIKAQFDYDGEFDLDLNEVMISEYEAAELERIYGYPIVPGMKINISIAKNSPELGQVQLFHAELEHFYNVTVRAIYRSIPSVSMLQKVFSASFLKDSVIFLRENMNAANMSRMHENGLNPIIMVKCKINTLKVDGIDGILPKLEDLVDRMKLRHPSSQSIILSTPTAELELTYGLAQTSIIFSVPIVVIGIILSLFTTNIVIELRKNQIETLQDRGAQKGQIIGIVLIEFLILSVISIFVAIGISFVLAGLIPLVASGEITWASFSLFVGSVRFPFSLVLYISLAAILITSIFAVVKLLNILSNNLEEKQRKIVDLAQKYAIYGALSFGIIVDSILLGIDASNLRDDIAGLSNYTLEQTGDSMTIFIEILILVMLVAVLAAISLTTLLGKLKWVYQRFIVKNYFFVANTFKKSKNRLSSLMIILIILASVNIFSMNLYATLLNNDNTEAFYNNGSDFRIHTTYVDKSFEDNISQIDGIREAMSVLKVEGLVTDETVTVYGIDAMKYLRIGRWESSPNDFYSMEDLLDKLNRTDKGIIISKTYAQSINITQNPTVTLRGLPNDSNYETFEIIGVIDSAPGLGLAYGNNLELYQANDQFMIINEEVIIRDYGVSDASLFFAKIIPTYTVDEVMKNIFELDNIIEVNPEVINRQYIGKYIAQFIPDVTSFILIEIMLINIIGVIIIGSNMEFLLSQRKQNNAILYSIGNSNRNLANMILSEILIIDAVAIFLALIIGIPLSLLCINISAPIFTSHNIIPYLFSFDFIRIPIFVVSLLILTLITAVPSIARFSRQNIAKALKN